MTWSLSSQSCWKERIKKYDLIFDRRNQIGSGMDEGDCASVFEIDDPVDAPVWNDGNVFLCNRQRMFLCFRCDRIQDQCRQCTNAAKRRNAAAISAIFFTRSNAESSESHACGIQITRNSLGMVYAAVCGAGFDALVPEKIDRGRRKKRNSFAFPVPSKDVFFCAQKGIRLILIVIRK